MITLLTIGQTPRDDLLDPLQDRFPKFKMQIIGALDGLDESDISRLSKGSIEDPLFVRTNYGSFNIEKKKIENRVQQIIHENENKSESFIICCTSKFELHSAKVSILIPIELMKEELKRYADLKKILICIPILEQLKSTELKWSNVKGKKIIRAVTPGKIDSMFIIKSYIEKYKPDIVVLDCYGYDIELARKVAQKFNGKVIDPTNIVISKLTNKI